MPNTTISKGKGVAGEWEYVVGREAAGDGAKGKAAAPAESLAPFRPTNAFASQRIQSIPYLHDPEAPKAK